MVCTIKNFNPLARHLNVLYPSLSREFVFSISNMNPVKTQSWPIFSGVRTAKRSAGCNHDDSLEDDCCVPYFKLEFFIPTLRHRFYSPNSSNIQGECDFASSASGNKLRKYTFLCFF